MHHGAKTRMGRHQERRPYPLGGGGVRPLCHLGPEHSLPAEAVRAADAIEFDGVRGKVFRAEYLVAIAASVGRIKDHARIRQLLEQTELLDGRLLEAILKRHQLKLPTA